MQNNKKGDNSVKLKDYFYPFKIVNLLIPFRVKKQYFLIPFFCCFFSLNSYPNVWINEIMQSNVDNLVDDLQDFPDSWVELYNDSGESVNIQNWSISDTLDYTKGWKITIAVSIPAKGYQLIYCDKVSNGMHSSFRLDSGKGGAIYLFDSSGTIVDQLTDIPKQPAPNIARGRVQDGSEHWSYFVKATPKSKNEGVISDRVLPAPVFSCSGGIYKNAVSLSFSLPQDTPDDITLSNIFYTTDGSEPTENSNAYTETITISETTPIRAKLIHPEFLTNRSVTQTYILTSKELALPVIAVNLDPYYLWDDEFGIYVDGNGVYGKTGNGSNKKVNWNNAWRRPMNVEYFPTLNDDAVLNQLGELRIGGGWSRANPQKSLLLYANKRFGEKRFDYPLFKQKPDQEVKSFMLRNAGNDFGGSFFKDAAIQLFMGNKVEVDYQAYQPAIIYMNGEYYGIQNLRERSNEDYVFSNFNGLEDIDMIERVGSDAQYELKAGDWNAYNELMAKLSKSNNQINFEEIIDRVDINAFLNYMILQIYIANTDFPHNNSVLWRPRTSDGKWRYILKDTDFGLDDSRISHNSISYNVSSSLGDKDRRLFSALVSYTPFKEEFYSRFAIYMGDILSYETTFQVLDSIEQMLEPEMLDHRHRWRGSQNLNGWHTEVTRMKSWCNRRPFYMYMQLRDYFKLKNYIPVTVNIQEDTDYTTGDISMNGVLLHSPEFNGKYFREKELKLKWNGDPGKVDGWLVTYITNEDAGSLSTTYYGSEVNFTIPENCTNLQFSAIKTTGIHPVSSNIKVYTEDDKLIIKGLTGKSLISVYTINGQLVQQTNIFDSAIQLPLGSKGMYLIKIETANEVITRKIIY